MKHISEVLKEKFDDMPKPDKETGRAWLRIIRYNLEQKNEVIQKTERHD